jgi:cell division septation protein DedD
MPPTAPAPAPAQPSTGTAAAVAPTPAGAAAEKAAPVTGAVGNGAYAVQVASFSGSKRKENAEVFKKRLEANAGLKADLVPSEDDKMVRVFVGNYPDRESAVKACEELKKRAGFAGSFVKRR